MRGPGLRLQLDIRRCWRCPNCGMERLVSAREVAVQCNCLPSRPRMLLIEQQRRQRPAPEPLPPYFEPEDFPAEPEASPSEPSVDGVATEVATNETITTSGDIPVEAPPDDVPAEGENDAVL